MTTKRTYLTAIAIAALAAGVPQVSAEGPAHRLVAARQDETRRLPSDNAALFTAASRQVSISLDLLSGDASGSALAGTLVTVVDASGNARQFTADDTGMVTVDEAQEGPHAVVASTDTAHGSSLFMFEEQEDAADAIDADLVETKPARMTLLNITADGLLPIIDDYLVTAEAADDASPFADDQLAGDTPIGPGFGFQVELGPNGELSGQVVSVAGNATGQSLAGTTVVILKDGQAVARDVTDADGRFALSGVRPGVHGVIAAGPAGYAAFAFEAISGDAVTVRPNAPITFVSTRLMAAGQLPVVLIPPQMVPAVIDSIRDFYPAGPAGVAEVGAGAGAAALAPGIAAAVGGAFAGAPAAQSVGSFGSGGGGAAGAGIGGGAGGLAMLAAVGGGAAYLLSEDDDDDEPGIVVSVSTP